MKGAADQHSLSSPCSALSILSHLSQHVSLSEAKTTNGIHDAAVTGSPAVAALPTRFQVELRMSAVAPMESLSLDETNQIRVANGLQPLAPPGLPSTGSPSQDEVASANYQAYQDQLKEAKEIASTSARIAKAMNQRALHAKRAGKGIGEEASAHESTKSWAKNFSASAQKRAAEVAAARRQQDQDEADAVAAISYSERDLRGLKVGHVIDAFDEGSEHVLTLRDSRIEDNEDDELVNVNFAEDARARDRLDKQRKGKRTYTGLEDDEFGVKRGILSKYDNGYAEVGETAGFRLGDDDIPRENHTGENDLRQEKQIDRNLLSLDYMKNVAVSDYMQEGDPGFKKSKKRKTRAGQQRTAAAAEDAETAMDLTPNNIVSRKELEDQALRDDEELQLALARARRENGRRRRQRAKEVMNVTSKEEVDNLEEWSESTPSGGLVLDDTTDFIRNIGSESTTADLDHVEQKPISRVDVAPHPTIPVSSLHEGTTLQSGTEMNNDDLSLLSVKAEMDTGDLTAANAEQEKLVSSSLSATLSILTQQGLLHKMTSEDRQRDEESREHSKWIADRRMDERLRQQARLAAKAAGDSKDQAQREAENRARDLEFNRRQMLAMENYRPNVDIKYTDEFGRNMNAKEAWKALCHAFHGHGSGAAKQEARLKKIADERRREAMASGDTPLNLNASFQARQERTGSATMVLSVGNRGTAPMLEGSLAPSLHANPTGTSSDRKVKLRESIDEPAVNLIPMLDAPVLAQNPHIQPQPLVAKERVGFARISRKENETSSENAGPAISGSPLGPSTVAPIKIAISKRKADDDGE